METLEELALTNIAAYLWNINTLPHIQEDWHWFRMRINIKEKVKIASGRELTTIVGNKLSKLVTVVFREIFNFLSYLYAIGIDNEKLKLIASRSCWMKGAVLDSTKTTFKAIQIKELSDIEKFHLASYFCIESYIQESWNILSDRIKNLLLNPKDINLTVENVWAFTLTSQEHRFEDTLTYYRCQCINEYIIINLVEDLHVDTAKFFFKKISQERKHLVLVYALESINNKLVYVELEHGRHNLDYNFPDHVNSLIVYLISQIEMEYLEGVLQNPIPTFRILICYLDWPYQKQFLIMAQIMKCYMTDEDFYYVSDYLNYKIEAGYEDFDYQSLLDWNN